ncbi:hypothetical protein ACKWTF_007346 [Chironomus riparius]
MKMFGVADSLAYWREFFGVKSENSLEIHNKASFNNINNNNCNIFIDNQKSSSALKDSYPQKFSKHRTEDSIQMTDIKLFNNKSDYQTHAQTNMREAKPYKCTQCTKAFANSSYLSQHTRIHLGIKPYGCEICQRKFTQLSHLQQHIRTHTGDKPYKCRNPGCVKAFSQLSNLQSHSRSHQTDKPFKCNSCYKCFNDETTLLQHIPKHKESKHLKTHICQYCGKSYTQETYLQKHLQKHLERAEKRNSGVQPGLGLRNSNGTEHSSYSVWPVKTNNENPIVIPESLQHSTNHHYEFVLNHNDQQHHSRNSIDVLQRNDSGNDVKDLTNSQTNHHLPVSSSSSSDDIMLSSTNTTTKISNNSAFTPINVINPHLNSLQHHQISQRPIYYDAIAIQNKNISQNTVNFPNQLISLHQIRNYMHHQPGGLVNSDHLISIGTAISKDKGQ